MWFASLMGGTVGRWLLFGGISALAAGALYGGGYLHGQLNSKSAAEVRQLEATVDHLQAEIARREARTAADNEARERADAERERFDERAEEAQNDPEGIDDLDRTILDERLTRRLRRLWPSP